MLVAPVAVSCWRLDFEAVLQVVSTAASREKRQEHSSLLSLAGERVEQLQWALSPGMRT